MHIENKRNKEKPTHLEKGFIVLDEK